MEILAVLPIIAIILVAVIFHEYAHGWVANRLGDPTAKMMGRLTLNPLKHIDPVGSIIVPFLLHLLGFIPLGWAKPVPVNFAALRNPKRDMIWVALAGPAINVFIAAFLSVFLRAPDLASLEFILIPAIVINLILAVFNMIPIPPLDGSRVLVGILPKELGRYIIRLEPFGLLIVLLALNFGLLNFIWDVVVYLSAMLGVDAGMLM